MSADREPTGHDEHTLPVPQHERWQPLRSGLLNLYRYDREEFWYEDGHLLLRGNNGTGKSRVLALQLPFLLDGEVSPHRMEPDGDPAKRADWNLLMGRYPDRLGYTWLEFGRLASEDEEPGPRYLTLGCGLSAVEGRGLVGKWFFLTDRRVGVDLHLEGKAHEALVRPRLVEALGDRGQVFTTAQEYRNAVDRSLFQLGRARYEALVNLLIQLRQPQLSRKLDEGQLSSALSEALPPLAPSVLADVAESFRTLESERDAIEALAVAGRGVDAFLGGYRRYTEIATRRRAEAVRTRHSAYKTTQRSLRAAEERGQRAERRLQEVDAELVALEEQEQAARAEVRTLEMSPEMRDKKALDTARRRAVEKAEESERAGQELERARSLLAHRERQHEESRERARAVGKALRGRLETARSEAVDAGLEGPHHQALDRLDLVEDAKGALSMDEAEKRVASAETTLGEAAERRERGVRHVRELADRRDAARRELATARRYQDERTTELEQAVEEQRDRNRQLEGSVGELLEAWRTWRAALVELEPSSAGELEEDLREWSRRAEGEGPLAADLRQAGERAADRLAREMAALERRREEETAERDRLLAEEKALREGVHPPPPAPHTRRTADREGREGAPFWQVCDFADDLPEDERAGLEAALEAAGMLDAWITPGGRLLDPEDHDTVLLTPDSISPGGSLDGVLVPQVDRDEARAASLEDTTIRAVLRGIGLGESAGESWVTKDGRFRLGPLQGRWGKEAAQHLGAGARAAERRRRLEALATEIAAVDERLWLLEDELDQVRKRRLQMRREAESAPDESAIRQAAAALDAATGEVSRARARLVEAEARVAELRRQLEQAEERLKSAAADLGVDPQPEVLVALASALAAYRRTLAALWPTVRQHLAARREVATAAGHLDEARADEARRLEIHRQRHAEQRAVEAERDTLERTVGVSVQEILRRLDEARHQAETLVGRRRESDSLRGDLRVEQAEAGKDVTNLGQILERESAERGVALERLSRAAEEGLLRIAVVDLDTADYEGWSVSRAVEVARRLEERLVDVDSGESAWERQQRDVSRRFEALKSTLLPYGYDPQLSMPDQLMVVTTTFQGRAHPLDSFRQALADEVRARERVLAAREREVIENHLLGEVALHLHERLREAEELVLEMNRELEERPMSTGMTLRFTWQPLTEDVTGLTAARRLLLARSGVWSPAERKEVGDFLHRLIQEERTGEDGTFTGTWQEHLSRALDYRTWHRFGVERRQDGQWRRLTRRSHGTGSGGEKAIALTIPQFAAAAAHYRSADPKAPRLILLDEAFVGVDADMRAKCMGLLEAFDLDFVMTSEREWGCYPTLSGLAIYQLATHPGIDAIGVSRWLWNGRERHRGDHLVLPPAIPSGEGEAGLPFEDGG